MGVEPILTVLIGTTFCGWLVATVGVTANAWANEDGQDDRFSEMLGSLTFLTPNWNFFAPHPGQYDYHLLYRNKRPDGSVSEWEELTEITETPNRLKWAWNPQLYRAKAMFDIGQDLSKKLAETHPPADADTAQNDDQDGIDHMQTIQSNDHIVTTQYMLLLNYVSQRAKEEGADKTQFMLMRSSLREEEPAPMFISNFHNV